MKAKRILSLVLALAMVFALAVPAFSISAEPEPSIATEHGEHSLAISPRMGCTVCKIGSLIEICEKERIWDSVEKHTYSGGKTCLINYFRSGGHYLCDTCGATRPFDYPEYGDEHLCVFIHSSCGKGVTSICPLNAGILPPEPFPYNEETAEK